jgi:hypothetical protein
MPSIKIGFAFLFRRLSLKETTLRTVLGRRCIMLNEQDYLQLLKSTCDSEHGCTKVLSHLDGAFY